MLVCVCAPVCVTHVRHCSVVQALTPETSELFIHSADGTSMTHKSVGSNVRRLDAGCSAASVSVSTFVRAIHVAIL